MQEHNYWLTTTELPATDSARPLPETVDVAVIGAGFTGLSAARTLAKRGRESPCSNPKPSDGAPVRATAAWSSPGMKLGVNKLISMYGRERTQRMYAASLGYHRLRRANRPRGRNRLRLLPLRTSRSRLQAEAFRRLRAPGRSDRARVQSQARVSCRKANCSSEIGSTIYYGGMVDEVSAGLNPARYVAGLAPRRDESRSGNLRTHASPEDRARIATRRSGLERSLPRAARSGRTKSSSAPAATPGRATPALQKKTHPDRIVHHHHRSPARSAGAAS